MNLPVAIDVIQECEGNLQIPEIRVWCHPHKIGREGDDSYEVFTTFQSALDFISSHKEAEAVPLIAFRGYELNIFAIIENKA